MSESVLCTDLIGPFAAGKSEVC